VRQILFVCVENARRSQIAENIFNTIAKEKGIQAIATSAGTSPAHRIDPMVVNVLGEIGIKLNEQKPKVLTKEMIKNADIMVNMGCLSEANCPIVFIDTAEDWNIEDPKGKSVETFRRVRDTISQKVEELIERIAKTESVSA